MVKHFLQFKKEEPLVKLVDTLRFLLPPLLTVNKLLGAILFDRRGRGWKEEKFQKVYMLDGMPNGWIMRI